MRAGIRSGEVQGADLAGSGDAGDGGGGGEAGPHPGLEHREHHVDDGHGQRQWH